MSLLDISSLGIPVAAAQRILLLELVGSVCRCGAGKQQNQTFCHACYKALPALTQKHLYMRMGKGYEGAYVAALGHLYDAGRIQALPEWIRLEDGAERLYPNREAAARD